MASLENEIKNKSFSRFHLIYGQERYMVRYYKNTLINHLSNPDDEMNRTFFKNEDIDGAQIAEAAQVLPFFAERRVLIVEDSKFFAKSNDFNQYLDSFPETTYLIFVERDVDKRNKLYKWFQKNGCVTECTKQQERMLKQWVAGYLKKAGKTISTSVVELLIERVGTEMEVLSNELEKLIGYVGERQQIQQEDIEKISSGITVSKIFDMIDAVATKQKKKALTLYDDLLMNKESPMSILYLFSRHINILLQMKECFQLGMNKNEIAGKCGVPPFTVAKYSRQSEMFKRSELLQMLKNRVECEELVKTGRLSEQISVEMFLIQALTNS